jgi:hypothetical protein
LKITKGMIVATASVFALAACNSNAATKESKAPVSGATAPPAAPTLAKSRDLSAAPTAVVVGGDAVAGAPLTSPLDSPVAVPVIGDAVVETFTMTVNADNKSALDVKIAGTLGDVCTALGSISQLKVGNVIRVFVKTSRDPDRMCAQTVKPFEATALVSLFTYDAGEFVIDVNGVTKKVSLSDKGDITFVP